MQHDLFVNPNRRSRAVYPLVVVLQAEVVEADTQIVAPLTTTIIVPKPPRRVLPLVSHDGRDYVVLMRLVGVLPARQLGQPVGSVARYRDDITRALDWLFFGI
jgi:mRNA-degrading endonuclease toxin of MazEF toxin-antitoxin module